MHGHSYTAWELVRHYYRRNRALCNTVIAAIAVTGLVAIASYVRILEANQRERAQRLAAEAEAYRANIQVAASDVRAERFLNARERLEQQHPDLRDWEWGSFRAEPRTGPRRKAMANGSTRSSESRVPGA